MRYAVIDIGSNTIKFLVAEKEGWAIKILQEESHTTRLAEDLLATAKLAPDAVERTLDLLSKLRKVGQELKVDQWMAVATSAVRDASNRKEFLKAAQERLHFPVRLLSGEEEAETIFLGVVADAVFSGQDIFVMDVGGGSAEWIQGKGAKIQRRMSLPLGCIRLQERFATCYPLSEAAIEKMLSALRHQLSEALIDFTLGERRMVGTGGTLTSTASILLGLKKFDPAKIHHYIIPRATLESKMRELAALTTDELEHVTGLPGKRVKIIVPGMAVFLVTMEQLKASEIMVSIRGLRYGVLEKLTHEDKSPS